MTVGDPVAHRFRDAMRCTASGVAVLTTDGPAGRAGVTVSTLCSLSLEPPSVIACIHQASGTLPAILANGAFAANVLAEDQQHVAEVFAGRVANVRDDRFAAGSWGSLATGSPVLEGALATFDCRVAKTFDFGSHRILIGEVVDVALQQATPLIYSDRAFRRLTA